MASELIALSLLVGILIFSTVDIQTHQKIKKIKLADQILPEMYGTTLIQQISYTQCISFI